MPATTTWLAQHLFITVALASAVWAICRLVRPHPAARHFLWLIVLCRMLIPTASVLPFPAKLPEQLRSLAELRESEPPIAAPMSTIDHVPREVFIDDIGTAGPLSSAEARAAMVARSAAQPIRPVIWLGCGWVVGSLVVVVVLTLRIRRVRRILSASDRAPDWLRADVDHWCRDLSLSPPPCLVSQRVSSPFVWCVGRPTLVWPAEFAMPEQREASQPIVIHELAHLKRRDHWTAWIEMAALVVWWWNPLTWLVRRQLTAAAESACDAWVIDRLPEQRREFAATLLAFSASPRALAQGVAAAGASSGSRNVFQHRLEVIMNDTVPVRFSRRMALVAGAIGLCSLPAFSTAPTSHDETPRSAQVESGAHQNTGETRPGPQNDTNREKKDLHTAEITAEIQGLIAQASPPMSSALREILQRIESDYYGDVDRADLERKAIEAIVSSLEGDAVVLTREEFADALTNVDGDIVGVGMMLEMDDASKRPVVIRPLPNSPAQMAGIQPGDVLVTIDGTATDTLSLADVVKRVRGQQGTTLSLTVERDGEPVKLDVVRDRFVTSNVGPWRMTGDGQQDFWVDADRRIAYAHIPAFTKHTPEQLRTILADLSEAGASGLILDLRSCPGGLLTAATQVADLFVTDGTIVSSQGRGEGENAVLRAKSDGTFADLPLAVLVDNKTASAAEIVAACLQDHHRATIIGEQTYGRGIVQSIFPLGDGGALKLTTAKWLRPNGRSLHRREGSEDWGVRPDQGFSIDANDEDRTRWDHQRRSRLAGGEATTEGDAPLQAALELLSQD